MRQSAAEREHDRAQRGRKGSLYDMLTGCLPLGKPAQPSHVLHRALAHVGAEAP
jgi:hypothetical protein